jgi:hypothetical protein
MEFSSHAAFDGRAWGEPLALLHPCLERIERPELRIDAERESCALRRRHRIGENAAAGGKSLDPIEQQRRRRGEPRRNFGDAADLVMGIGAVDAAQRAERIDCRDEAAQVLVHVVFIRRWSGGLCYSHTHDEGTKQSALQ